MQWTPSHYPKVNGLVESIRAGLRRVLGVNLVAVYLYGSLVTGDFDADISDVDLLAVLGTELSDIEFDKLDRLHSDLAEEYPDWRGRIEIAYVACQALRTFRTESSVIAVISPGEPFHRVQAGRDWLVNWTIVRNQGQTLFGPPAQTFIEPISRDEYIGVVCSHMRQWPEWLGNDSECKFQSYAILTLCRAVYTVQFGEQASKRQAADWVASRWPEWRSLIDRAFEWRSAQADSLPEPRKTLPHVRDFVSFAQAQVDATQQV